MNPVSEKFEILYTLGGAPARREEWINYLDYGFIPEDLPELMLVILGHDQEQDGDAVWAGLHAWRTLGQLGCDEAATALVAMFDILVEDDWALSDLPVVVGMIGAAGIEPLAACLNDSGQDEFARVMAAHGLCEVAQRHPQCRETVLEHFKAYMVEPDFEQYTLNGLMISYLLDLDAKELIEEIRELFDKHIVDLSCVGDIEDVEIEFGLRNERESPKPQMLPFNSEDEEYEEDLDPPLPFEDGPIAYIEYYLDCYGHDGSILDASELHGYFVSLACSPQLIMPSVWMPVIWGGEEYAPEWEDLEETETFTDMVMAFYNSVLEEMSSGEFDPLFLEGMFDGESVIIVDEWCHGFLRGLDLWGVLSTEDEVVVSEAIKPMQLFTSDESFDLRKEMGSEAIEAKQLEIAPAIASLYRHFRGQVRRSGFTQVREVSKIGRNDPCPCGSGKKYKKCCLH